MEGGRWVGCLWWQQGRICPACARERRRNTLGCDVEQTEWGWEGGRCDERVYAGLRGGQMGEKVRGRTSVCVAEAVVDKQCACDGKELGRPSWDMNR